MNDQELDPELRAAEANGELATPDIGGETMANEAIKEVEDDLRKLPYELSDVFNRVAPGLRGVVFERSRELAAKLMFQLNNATEREPYGDSITFDAENAAVGDTLESLKLGEITSLVAALRSLAEQLEDRAQEQNREAVTIDLDALNSGEPRAVQQIWYILSGEAEVGAAGHEVQAGPYTLTVEQTQDTKGPGAESTKLVIRQTDADEVDFAMAA